MCQIWALVCLFVEGTSASVGVKSFATALDSLHWDDIVGTIAGDETVMCAIRTVEDTKKLMKRLEDVLK